MKIQDFGFEPVIGKDYVVNFTSDGELLSTSIYNGSALPAVAFPDNKKILLTITDKETGKVLQSTEFISYNGKLYKSVFELPLKNELNNMNANVYIKNLHYDLTSGSVLVQIQGFEGDPYKLSISDTTVNHKAFSMPITLQNDTYYAVATELVQGNEFKVLLEDQYGKSIDEQIFTAPISTDWRFTDTVENGKLQLDGETIDPQDNPADPNNENVTNVDLDPIAATHPETDTQTDPAVTGQDANTTATTEEPSFLDGLNTKQIGLIGAIALLVILTLILIIRLARRKKAKKQGRMEDEEYLEDEVYEDVLADVTEEVSPDKLEDLEDVSGNAEDLIEDMPPLEDEEPKDKGKKKKKGKGFGFGRK